MSKSVHQKNPNNDCYMYRVFLAHTAQSTASQDCKYSNILEKTHTSASKTSTDQSDRDLYLFTHSYCLHLPTRPVASSSFAVGCS